ncbi:MAG: class I SAM-dependent methyltransferase [Clostridiales Family XIII bacterium]|jgi:ubiquinone/menaquinone biosynthesis C-methylase UbiE|nr:class I SAM-dependent methyltransferase [Clostridiales Family XIII bacterium]
MGVISPGNFDLIGEAMDLCAFPKGARILEVGCGEGAALAWLEGTYGVKCTGIDSSDALLRRGRELRPGLDLRRGEMEMLDFPSFAFDGVIMECALSLSPMQLEALHEAWCVLKKGGRLIVADLCRLDPDPAEVARVRAEARKLRRAPHAEGDCERDRNAPSEYCLEGAFVVESLREAFGEAGFEILFFGDKTEVLRGFAAEQIFAHGSWEAFWRAALPPGEEIGRFCRAPARTKDLGYFLAVLRKPE